MVIYKTISKLITKYYLVILVLVVLISYGQILGMYVWQDDNALFFKLANIEGKAGYLGSGPFGIGPYKYTATPYIPIYQLFGHNTVPYFTFTLLLYLFTTFVIYKVFSNILGTNAGRLAGFLYGAGYIASDGFIRLFNSVITSVSVILIALLTLFFWKLYQAIKEHYSKFITFKWYLLALLVFFLATELARARTHYLVGVVIAFEVLFLTFNKPIKSIFYSLLRLVPFTYIFYRYFIIDGDQRSGQVTSFIHAIADGQYYQTYSFITSITRVVFPDWITSPLVDVGNLSRPTILLFALLIVISFFKKRYRVLKIGIFLATTFVWVKLYKALYTTPVLDLGTQQFLYILIGGLLLIYFAIGLFITEQKRLYLFLLIWFILNILAYGAYNPTVLYESINRYFAHSFFALIGLACVIYAHAFKNAISKKIFLAIAILWGLGNLTAAVSYQKDILLNRSNPPRIFYSQLQQAVPKLQKGEVFYFDVADNAQADFNKGFSVAQMPESTAIAWRYGVDRYDLQLFTNFNDLIAHLGKGNFNLSKIHTFYYSKRQLFETSNKFKELVASEGSQSATVDFTQHDDSTIQFNQPIEGVWPMEFTLTLQPEKVSLNNVTFPFMKGVSDNISSDRKKALLALDYQRDKKANILKAMYTVSSQWRDRVVTNLRDGDLSTVWQADRLIWTNNKGSFTIDLGGEKEIDRFVWVNGYGSNTPTEYKIEVSTDGTSWQQVKEVVSTLRIDDKNPQVVAFSPIKTRLIRMYITKTLNNDSPAIAESWVVPTKYDGINIVEAEKFLKNPLKNSQDLADLQSRLEVLGNQLEVGISWKNNKSDRWLTKVNKNVTIDLSNKPQSVKILIPQGGTSLEKIMFEDKVLPMKVKVESIKLRRPTITEILGGNL